MPKKLIIAIDGPAGSGKSTTARAVARILGYVYIDTGAMYRAVTFLALREKILGNDTAIVDYLKSGRITLKPAEDGNQIFWNSEDLTDQLRSQEVNGNVSEISSIPQVREELTNQQREIGKQGGVVMEGRDIGTVVFPQADLKFYLTADIEKRAVRRHKEVTAKADNVSVEHIKENLATRDHKDSSRKVNPLQIAEGAIKIDTSHISFEEQVSLIIQHVRALEEQSDK